MSHCPAWTYVLRRRSQAEGIQAQVVVIRSKSRLSWEQVRHQLEMLTHYSAEEFEEVAQEPDTAIVLDTWEPGIENLKPDDMGWPAVRTYKEWWKPEELTPAAVY